jgi:hypothetical protein
MPASQSRFLSFCRLATIELPFFEFTLPSCDDYFGSDHIHRIFFREHRVPGRLMRFSLHQSRIEAQHNIAFD